LKKYLLLSAQGPDAREALAGPYETKEDRTGQDTTRQDKTK
jgi:hypothetical protein